MVNIADTTQACMITGHRDFSTEKVDYIEKELTRLIWRAVQEGYTHFVSGFASGADLIFAEIVVGLKRELDITLEAAIPHRSRLKSPDMRFRRALSLCDKVTVYSENYSKACFMIRNRGMVDMSSRIIAVYDYRGKGGTYNTMVYARASGKQIKIVDVR